MDINVGYAMVKLAAEIDRKDKKIMMSTLFICLL